MIAKNRAEAARQAAIAERRKAIFEKYGAKTMKAVLNSVYAHASALYIEGGLERVNNFLVVDSIKVIQPALLDLYGRIVYTLKAEASADKKSLANGIETKATQEEIDAATRAILDGLVQYAYDSAGIIASTSNDYITNFVTRQLGSAEFVNAGPRAMARAMVEYGDEISLGQAERIARTETLSVYSEAQAKFTDEIWDEAEMGPLYKQWYSNRDKRVRDDHKKMNNRIVPNGDPFVMPNGDAMMYPGDRSSAKPENYVNCRCSYAAIPEELVPERQRTKPINSPNEKPTTPKPVQVVKPIPPPIPAPKPDPKPRLNIESISQSVELDKLPKKAKDTFVSGLVDVFSDYGLKQKLNTIKISASKGKRVNASFVETRFYNGTTVRHIEIRSSYAKSSNTEARNTVRNFTESKQEKIKLFANNQGFEDELKKINETERWSISSVSKEPLKATAWHEAAHAIERDRGLGDWWRYLLKKHDALKDAHKVSEYATKDPSELFAEVMAAIKDGKEDLIPESIKKAFDEAIKFNAI